MLAIARLPRTSLSNYPTPLTKADRLLAALSGARILFRREDLSDLTLGGNKCCKLEFIMADAKLNPERAVHRQGYHCFHSFPSYSSNSYL